jgi:hypothetical protein
VDIVVGRGRSGDDFDHRWNDADRVLLPRQGLLGAGSVPVDLALDEAAEAPSSDIIRAVDCLKFDSIRLVGDQRGTQRSKRGDTWR